MDLVATVMVTKKGGGGHVDVSRLNGQRVFGASFETEAEGDGDGDDEGEGVLRNSEDRGAEQGKEAGVEGFVRAVTWRRDGQILAVACADGTVSLINAFTGKIAHRLSTRPRLRESTGTGGSFSSSQSQAQAQLRTSSRSTQPSSSPESRSLTPTILSWNTHFASPSPLAIRLRLEQPESQVTLDHILGLRADVDKLLRLKADLPRELSALDVEMSLPRLATLPPQGVGTGDDIFSSRSSVDAVFHASGPTGSGPGSSVDSVDALLMGLQGDDDGRCAVHLRVFDSFEIGAVDVGGCLPGDFKKAKVIRVGSHPFLSTIFLVVEQSAGDRNDSSLHLVSLDLRFIPQTGRNLPLVARKATQLGNLLRYISQVQMQLVAEVKAAFDLPTRFLRNINESLAEADENSDFTYAAHHLAVTGYCDPKFKEWLVDEVGERGLKRWDKAVGDCLDIVRRLTSECLMPALERCLVVLSRLDGLARFGPTSSRLGLGEISLRKVRETVDVLGILAEDLLLDVGVEIKEFAAFMKWLKWECEVEALEEGSERAEELRESWTGESELKMVLEYVGGAMKESRTKKYIGSDGQQQSASDLLGEDTDAGFYADYVKRRAGSSKDKKMPTLAQLVERMQKQAEAVFGQVAETFRKSILPSYMLELPARTDGQNIDLRVAPDEEDDELFRLFVVSKDKQEESHVRQAVVKLQQEGGKGLKFTTISNAVTKIPEVREILDVKLVDDTAVMALAATATDIRLFSRQVTSDEAHGWELQHVFEAGRMDAGMRPARLEVNGRIGRRVVAVIDEAGLGYVVLDLDAAVDAEDGRGGDAGDEVMTG
ncbi:hypothetical protein LTR72_001936 [Exophiala xenobiotica]|nr:hypothetical protein LTR72_001936 [Exophiala xenobiotica]KAK5302511.1 hypothetical protein LTR14_000760 [Exophiala xenobiotica]KAK5480647.1 hypothetical protein LTR55_007150 [Exophiala xenobiotica]